MPILICQQCGRMFEVTPSREHSARYCSKECQIAATQKKEAKCECCGKEFNPFNRKNPRFCSRKMCIRDRFTCVASQEARCLHRLFLGCLCHCFSPVKVRPRLFRGLHCYSSTSSCQYAASRCV